MPRSFPPSPAHEDPAVAAVEHILAMAASPAPAATTSPDGRLVVASAVEICACVTNDDAPTWLIYSVLEGHIARRRVPYQVESLSLIDARRSASGHADPTEVLRWLQGEAPDPWWGGGGGSGDLFVLDEMQATVLGLDTHE